MEQNDFDFRDRHIKIVQRKVLPLNHQILCCPVIQHWGSSFPSVSVSSELVISISEAVLLSSTAVFFVL